MEPSSPPSPRPFHSSKVLGLVAALALAGIVTAVWINTVGKRFEPHQPPVAAKPGPDKGAVAVPGTIVAPEAKAEPKEETAAQPAAESATTPSEAPPAPPPPWQATLQATLELPGYTDVAFAPLEQAFDRPDRDDLTPWFEKTAAAGFRISKIPTQYGKSGTMEGIGRLLSPWPADGVLRLALDNFNRLKMHFFHGLEGATLVYYEEQGNRWAAYATTREEGKPTPKTWAITATDDDRFRRTEPRPGGPVELRYRDGELMLSRGDVVLLTAPLSGPPSDVFFEGRATIHGIALARTKDAPAEIPSRPVAAAMLTVERAGELNWTATKPEIVKPAPQADGSLLFAADSLLDGAGCYLPLPTGGIHEIILELADVTPGVMLYLGRDDGEPREVLFFRRDRRSGQLAVQHRGTSDAWERDFEPPSDSPTPLVQPRCWLRLLYGCGNLRWWLSTDGRHWAQTLPATDEAAPRLASLGLELAARRPDVGVTVKRVLVRPLEGLSSLATAELIEQAPAITADESLEAWLAEAMQRKPDKVDTADWLRACTVAALGRGAPRRLAYLLLEALLDDAAARGLPVGRQLAALDDAMLMALDVRDGQAMRRGVLSRYAELGVRAADQERLPAWSSVRRHYHAAPVVTRLQDPTDLDRVIRWELVASAYGQRQRETRDALTRLRFFDQVRRSEDGGLADWALWHTRREAPEQAVGQWASRVKESWRHPLVEELSKDTYNALTELQAVLESQAWEDAARLVTSLDPATAEGIAPYVNDRSLLTSIPVAVQLALEDYPQVRQSLGERFEALAKLRIAQATSAGDAAAIALASVQFAGTAAVAEAHRWLGDEALAQGRFERAIRQYERARDASRVIEAEIAPRLRLAGAMLGRDIGTPVQETVQFGDVSMSAAEFEALVAEMRTRESGGGLSAATQQATVPPPSGFETHVRSRLDGPLGDRPQEETGRRTNQLHVPWADRQLATAVEGDVMYVANRFQVAAYRLTTGERLWQSQTPPGRMQRAQDFALIAMRPVIHGDRIFVRLLYSPSPLLVCLEKSSGKLLWATEHREREFLISDPLMIEGQLVALAITIEHDQQARLQFFAFEPRTGEVLRQRELVHLRNTWGSRGCCEVAETEEGLVVALGGVTLALDSAGEIDWIRTHVVLPADDDPGSVLQQYQRPIVHGRRLYVAQPGVRTVDCLDAATGRQHWSAVLPEVLGTVGLAGNVLVVRTEGDIRGLDVKTGATRWRYTADNLYSFQLMSDDRLLVARRERVPGKASDWQPRLEWLDPADGKLIATTALPKLTDEDPRLGPLVAYTDRLFTFYGRGQHDPVREVVELVPHGEADATPATPDAWHAAAMRP